MDEELAWKNNNKMMRNDEKTDLFTKLQSESSWKNNNKMMTNDEKTDLFTKLQSGSTNIHESDKKDDEEK